MNEEQTTELRMRTWAFTLRRLAIYCEAIYENATEFRERVMQAHLEADIRVRWLQEGNTEVGIVVKPGTDHATVIFRGTSTDNRKDVQDNTKVKREVFKHAPPILEATVHRGYYAQARAITPQLLSMLKDLRVANVTVTGHSLGGAVAEIWSAMHENTSWLTVKRCITFGAPRPGNKAFAQYLDSVVPTVMRVVHGWDIAPKWPSASIGYRHPGVQWWISRDGFLHEDYSRWHDLFPGPWVLGWADHKIGEYIKKLRQAQMN